MGSFRRSRGFLSPMLVRNVVLLLGLGSRFVGGWIALSKDGYMVTKNLALDNGTVVEGDFLAKGIIQSANRTWRGPTVPIRPPPPDPPRPPADPPTPS